MKTEAKTLSRERELPRALDFEALLEVGIRRAQQASGAEWTDYNPHDPGVTILEQACYALVDIAYRASHPVVDIIDTVFAASDRTTDPGGEAERNTRMATDFPMPALALSSAPVTAGDFEALLADTFPDLRAVWMQDTEAAFLPDGSRMPAQQVDVLCYPAPPENAPPQVSEDTITAFLNDHRLLGQHIAGVQFLTPHPFRFTATIDAAEGQDPDDLIVDVLHNIDMALCPPMLFRARDTLPDLPVDTLFEGPFLHAGRAAQWDALRHPPARTNAWLQRIILNTLGVASLRNVAIETPEAATGAALVLDRASTHTALMVSTDDDGARAPGALRLAEDSEENRQGHIMAALNHRLNLIREEMDRYRRRGAAALSARVPAGKRRPRLAEYRSIQHDFPAIYQLGTASGEDKTSDAGVRDLRAFLVLMEQPLADMLQQIRLAPDLLSAGPEHSDGRLTTYARAALHDCGASPPPGFLELLDNPPGYPDDPATLLTKADPHGLRYEDFLDHLLARFNESFDTARLAQFTPPTGQGMRAGARDRIRAKQRFLRQLNPVPPDTTPDEISPHHRTALSTHRGSAAPPGDGPAPLSALALRVQLKTLLDTPPVVLEHHLLAGARPNRAEQNAFFRFSDYPGPTGIRGSIALRVKVSENAPACDVFLHDRHRVPSPTTCVKRLHDLMQNAVLDARQCANTGTIWHTWRSAGEQGIDLVLLSPVEAARDAVFERFAARPGLLKPDNDTAKITPLLYPADFGAWQMTVTARTRVFSAADATRAFADIVAETVMAEAPAMLQTHFFAAHSWPLAESCDNALVLTDYDAFCDAVASLHPDADRTADNAVRVRLARTVAELAYRRHVDTMARVLPS